MNDANTAIDRDLLTETLLVARHYLALSSNLVVTDLPEKDDGTTFKTDNGYAVKMIDAFISAFDLDTSRVYVPLKTFL
jgi:hypothetical protein